MFTQRLAYATPVTFGEILEKTRAETSNHAPGNVNDRLQCRCYDRVNRKSFSADISIRVRKFHVKL